MLRLTGPELSHSFIEFTASLQLSSRWYIALQQGNELGSNRLTILTGALAESLIKVVRNVFDIECWHMDTLWRL